MIHGKKVYHQAKKKNNRQRAQFNQRHGEGIQITKNVGKETEGLNKTSHKRLH